MQHVENTLVLSIFFCITLFMSCSSSKGFVIHSRNSSIYVRSPPFVRWYDGPFEVTAALVKLEGKEDCDYSEHLQGQILMTTQEDIEKFCGFAEASDHFVFAFNHKSIGLIHIASTNQHLMDFTAWKLSPSLFHHGGQMPAVIASKDTEHKLLTFLRESNGRPLNVTISSADPNTAVEVIKSPWTVALFSTAGLLSAFNIFSAILKILSFKSNKKASKSFILSWFILIPEILANSARLMLSVNTVFFVDGALNWQIYRILAPVSVPLGFTSTLAVSSGLYGAYRKYKGGKRKKSSRLWQNSVSLFFVSSALVVLVDIIHSIIAAFYTELIDVYIIAMFYAVVQIPLIYFFLVYGTRVSKVLMAGKGNVDKRSMDRVLKFVHRVRFSGVALMLNQTNMVAFATIGETSFPYWYTLYGFLLHTWGWVGLFQIAAVRSSFDFSFTSWLRKVSMFSTYRSEARPRRSRPGLSFRKSNDAQ